jgi:glycerol-3-phosphate O-acyltransferase
MNIAGFIFRPLYWTFGKVFSLWARPAIQPEAPSEYITDDKAAVCYVLETGGLADVLALEKACAANDMPSPTESFVFCGVK